MTSSLTVALRYLDNCVVFIGSTFGDSQLLKLKTEPVRHRMPHHPIPSPLHAHGIGATGPARRPRRAYSPNPDAPNDENSARAPRG